jgi:hypothetical protein
LAQFTERPRKTHDLKPPRKNKKHHQFVSRLYSALLAGMAISASLTAHMQGAAHVRQNVFEE